MNKNLPSFRVTFDDGTSYVTSMAAGVTLADARSYFVGQRFVQPDEKTFKTVATVTEFQCEVLPVTTVPVSGAVTAQELGEFFFAIAAKFAEHQAATFADERLRSYLELAPGRRFVKLVSRRRGMDGGSAYCFLDLTNGDILKAASWKAPAKGARGNIRSGTAANWFNEALGPYGAAYLR